MYFSASSASTFECDARRVNLAGAARNPTSVALILIWNMPARIPIEQSEIIEWV